MSTMKLEGLLIVSTLACATVAPAAVRVKANNTTDLNVGSSWVGSAVPSAADMAQWDSTVTGVNAVNLGANLSVRGLTVANSGGGVTIGGANTLTLGGEGLIMRPVGVTADLTVTCSELSLLIYAGQIWDIASGRIVTVNPAAFTRPSGSSIGFVGAGTVAGSALSNDATGIMGAWARTGSGTATRYAAVSGGAVAPYTFGTAAATAADVTDTAGAVNYDLAAVGAFGSDISFHTLRYTGTVGTVSGAYRADGLMNAGSGALTFSGATAIGAGKELVVTSPDSTRRIAFSGVIADNPGGASGLTVAGGGQVDLYADNTYSGQTVIGAGRIYMNKPNALGATNGNTVIHVIGSSVTGGILHVAGNITVAEPLTFVGPGDGTPWNSALYSNAGTNTLTGPITVSTLGGCRMTAGGGGTGLNLNGPITRTTSGNTLIIGAGGAGGVVNVNGPINNNGGSLTTHSGPGLVRLYSASNNVGTLNVQTYHTVQLNVSQAFIAGCALQVGGGSTTSGDQARGIFDMNGFSEIFNDFRGDGAPAEPPTVRVVTNSSPALSVFTIGSANGGGTFNGHIDGNIALVKNGTGTSTLCGPNRYTAGTTVNGGVLVLSNAVNHGALTVNGGTFRFAPSLAVSGALAGTGGTIDTLAAGSPLAVDQEASSTFAGVLTGAGTLTKSGAGTLTLSGANTYSGGTAVSEGCLVFGKLVSKPAAGSVAVAAGAALGLGVGTNTSTYFSAADVDSLWAGTLPGVTLDADSLVGIDTSAGDITYATGQSTRGLVKSGNNTLTLAGANSYPGKTVVRQGALSIGSAGALPGWDSAGRYEVWPGAALAVQNAIGDADVATMLGTGNFLDGACIGFDTAAGNRTYTNELNNTASGALGLYKLGANTLALTNANTYDGTTTVNGGVLVVRHSSALGSTNGYTLVNRFGGTPPLYTDSTGQVQLDGSGGGLTLDENFILNGAEQYGYLGALRSLSGNNTLNGWIKIGPASARIGVNSGTVTLNGPIVREFTTYNPMLVLNPNAGMLIVSNRIDIGAGGLNFHSGGTVWLCSTGNIWTGYEQIQYGCTVRLGADNALPTGIKVTLGNAGTPPGNGTLDLYGFGQTVGGLAQYGNDASYPNNLIRNTLAGEPSTLTVSQAAGVNDFFSGRLIGNLGLVKAGAANSSLTLNSTNTFSGATLVAGGTLALSPTGTLGVACTNITVSAGTLSVQNSAALADAATLSLSAGGAGKVSLAADVTEKVAYLLIGGELQRPGTYGSADSAATYKDSTYFSGTGVLSVLHGKSTGTQITVK